MFITFEGIDGSGKSTLTHMLAEYLGCRFAATPGTDYAPIRDAATRDVFTAFHYYVSSCYAVSALAVEQDIVCDRYIHSTLAYNWPFTHDRPQDALSPFPQLRRPDKSFLLVASREVRLARMLERQKKGGQLTALDLAFEAQDKALAIMSGFKDLTVIDTTELDKDGVLDKVVTILAREGLA